jgi:hypothetical protein
MKKKDFSKGSFLLGFIAGMLVAIIPIIGLLLSLFFSPQNGG